MLKFIQYIFSFSMDSTCFMVVSWVISLVNEVDCLHLQLAKAWIHVYSTKSLEIKVCLIYLSQHWIQHYKLVLSEGLSICLIMIPNLFSCKHEMYSIWAKFSREILQIQLCYPAVNILVVFILQRLWKRATGEHTCTMICKIFFSDSLKPGKVCFPYKPLQMWYEFK